MLTIIMSSFSQCSSAQKLQAEAPTTFGDIYCKKQVSGIAEGPASLNIYIEIKDSEFIPDSVYFRERVVKLERHSQKAELFIGQFMLQSGQKQDIIMSGNSKAEYGNKMPKKPVKIPFELAYDECVVSYKINGKTKYYKLTNVEEIHSIDVPM
jgi:hypothetical protein